MEASTQEKTNPELRYLLGQIDEEQLRTEVAEDPTLCEFVADESGWLKYKAVVFETIARGYAKILLDQGPSLDAAIERVKTHGGR